MAKYNSKVTAPYTLKGAYLAQAYGGWIAACFYSSRTKNEEAERMAAKVLEDAIKARNLMMATHFRIVRQAKIADRSISPIVGKIFWEWMASQGIPI